MGKEIGSSRRKKANQLTGNLDGDQNLANMGIFETVHGWDYGHVDADAISRGLPVQVILTGAIIHLVARSKQISATEVFEPFTRFKTLEFDF